MTADATGKRFPPAARADLRKAFEILEGDTFAARLSRLTFGATDRGMRVLPRAVVKLVEKAVGPALDAALALAVRTLGKKENKEEGTIARHIHKAAVAVSGAAGGVAGLPGLVAELPLTTVIMLRRIAAIARRNGEDLSDPATRIACLEVFALTGLGAAPAAIGSTYYTARIALHGAFRRAADELGKGGGRLAGAAFRGVLAKISAKVGKDLARVAATRVIPAAGAASGAALNALFMDHYQELAEAHFAMRRLERQYGAVTVQKAYERLRKRKVQVTRRV